MKPFRRNMIVVGLLLLGGFGGLRLVWWFNRLTPDPHHITLAMMPAPKDGPYYDDAEIIDAIKEYGDVNGLSRCSDGTQLSLIAAASMTRPCVLQWLLTHGANPNPPGINPLLKSIECNDVRSARLLLEAGADASLPSKEPAKSIKEWTAEQRSEAYRALFVQ